MAESLAAQAVLQADHLSVFYGTKTAIKNVSFSIREHAVYALIGPSGCGKSTLLRCFNRMNDFIPDFHMNGSVRYRGLDIYDHQVDPVIIRKRVGMVFQKPNPFPSSIFKNVAWGPVINGYKNEINALVEDSLKRAALWEEVKDRLKESGLSLSGGQQQRLCIARAIAMNPDVILMDEPCASLDPMSTSKIEQLITDLKKQYSILIVTHNMQQALRISDFTAFMYQGELIEFGLTQDVFNNPQHKLTQDYVSGRFG